MEMFFIIALIGTIVIFLYFSKIGKFFLFFIIIALMIGVAYECHNDEEEKKEHEGKVQMYHNGRFEWMTPEEKHKIFKEEAEEHHRKWAAEHPKEAEKERKRDSIFKAHYGY